MRFFPLVSRPALLAASLSVALAGGFAAFAPSALAAAEMAALPEVDTTHVLEVTGGWVRPSAGKTGAVYLTLTNKGASGEALTGVTSPVADKVQVHSMTMDGTIMRMRRLDTLDLPAGGSVALAPGGLHIMLIGLKAPLKVGDTVALHLSFDSSGPLDLTVPVQSTPPVAEKNMPEMPDMPDMNVMPGTGDHP